MYKLQIQLCIFPVILFFTIPFIVSDILNKTGNSTLAALNETRPSFRNDSTFFDFLTLVKNGSDWEAGS